jgi:hypothetical protein
MSGPVALDVDLREKRRLAIQRLNIAYANNARSTPQTKEAIREAQRDLGKINDEIIASYKDRNGDAPIDTFRKKREIIGDLLKWAEESESAQKDPRTTAAEKLFQAKCLARLRHILRMSDLNK